MTYPEHGTYKIITDRISPPLLTEELIHIAPHLLTQQANGIAKRLERGNRKWKNGCSSRGVSFPFLFLFPTEVHQSSFYEHNLNLTWHFWDEQGLHASMPKVFRYVMSISIKRRFCGQIYIVSTFKIDVFSMKNSTISTSIWRCFDIPFLTRAIHAICWK